MNKDKNNGWMTEYRINSGIGGIECVDVYNCVEPNRYELIDIPTADNKKVSKRDDKI